MNSERRIPSLDGWRAISIAFVLCWHLIFFKDGRWIDSTIDYGTLGVFAFFVISGFIITRLLLDERERTGGISLKNFYLRRAFRILPALFCFLGGLAILTKLGLAQSSPRAIILSLSFLRNYRPSPFTSLRHLWSLSVEEQFYLVWPFLLCRFSNRNASKLLIGVVIAAPIARLILWATGASGVALTWHSESVADGLAMGCLLALGQRRLHENRIYQRFARSNLCLLLPVVTLGAAALEKWPLVYQGLGKSIIFASIALGMDVSILRPLSFVGRVLNSRPFVVVGRWSYSLYLWQQVFLLQPAAAQKYAWFPMNLALSFLAAVASFYLIEQPFLEWRRKITSRHSCLVASELQTPLPLTLEERDSLTA